MNYILKHRSDSKRNNNVLQLTAKAAVIFGSFELFMKINRKFYRARGFFCLH